MHYLLNREDGHELQVDTDLWICCLDLAARSGWMPMGTINALAEATWDPLSYVEPAGQTISREDALALSKGLTTALDAVPDSEVPMQDKPFGSEVTAALLAEVARGEAVPADDMPAAAEILSGEPKTDARNLVEFLQGGALTLKNPAGAGT